MIQNASQRIARLLIGNSILNGLANGYTEASRRIRIFGQYLLACLSQVAGAGNAIGSPGHHHQAAVGFLFIANPHHEYPAFKAEHLARHAQCTSPLAGSGLGGKTLYAESFVVIGLGHGGVGLVRSRRTHPFILVVDLHRGIQQFLQISRPVQRGGTPEEILFQYFLWDVDPTFSCHFLFDEIHRKNRSQIVGTHGLPCPWM